MLPFLISISDFDHFNYQFQCHYKLPEISSDFNVYPNSIINNLADSNPDSNFGIRISTESESKATIGQLTDSNFDRAVFVFFLELDSISVGVAKFLW